jgi:hypothetical protein
MSENIDRYTGTPSLLPVREDALHALSLAATDKSSHFRTAAVASIGHDGKPQVRTMIVRAFDPETHTLMVYTDARSPKVTGFEQNKDIQLLFYDPDTMLQMRVSGKVTIHQGDALTEKLWSTLPEYGRGDYLSRQPPGEQIAHPGDSWLNQALGGQYFTVIEILITEIDWLKLSAQGHKRALLTWDDDTYSARWLAP